LTQQQQYSELDKQQEIAKNYCEQINTHIKLMGAVEPVVREKLFKEEQYLTILNAALPITLSIVSVIGYLVFESLFAGFINLGNVIIPILLKGNKSKMNNYQDRSDLQHKFIALQGYINRLALTSELKSEAIKEINKILADYCEMIPQIGKN
jgi:hypothetical protein